MTGDEFKAMSAKVRRPARAPTAPGVIEAAAVYTLSEFAARMNMTRSAMREARRLGLKVRRIGKRAFVLGRDAIEFIEACGK
jgi:hypothetical protein